MASTASIAFAWPLQFCTFTTIATFVASIVTLNVSQVDRLWTFLPTIYVTYFAFLPLWSNRQLAYLVPYTPRTLGWAVAEEFSPRALLMFSLVVLWMFRLSYNTYRRGLFNLSDEDYRWAVLRKQLHPVLFQITNFVFISGIQNLILLLLGLPAYVAAVLQPHSRLEVSDWVFTVLALAVLGFEFTADNQQYSYQAYKHAYLASKRKDKPIKPYDPLMQWPGSRLDWTPTDAERGFIAQGLWAYSRHPNFLCEQSFWWIITLMPLAASAPPGIPSLAESPSLGDVFSGLPYSVLDLIYPLRYLSPAIVLSLLFISSTCYTENITRGKYTKAYAAYQERVSMFNPLGTLVKIGTLKFSGKNDAMEALIWGKPKQKGKGKAE
ncbi:DUF1295-domain-containing protein [Pluteus cervinus]|uniref:DUF1295-domain-containing protein n=1 Tax=Pluteus cervinus TaxID=181527 RepID=A0ACD3B4U1_9AGAR|nr:DUF1295-domain-containing protein [Pluteus cervinus]